MKDKIVLMRWAVLLLLVILHGCGNTAPDAEDNNTVKRPTPQRVVERVQLPFKEHGYSNFETTFITSASAFEAFINDVARQEHWNNKEAFLQALKAVPIDFTVKNLLLYRITEGSGSIHLTPTEPETTQQQVTITIKRSVPEIGTADMAYYLLAYVVDSSVPSILFKVGEKRQTVTTQELVVCPAIYAPVCGAKPVTCITAPCYPVIQTYGNSCTLAADADAYKLYEGECLPLSCKRWHDGCNSCSLDEKSGALLCTERACFETRTPYCLDE